jgi:hypothetical protein
MVRQISTALLSTLKWFNANKTLHPTHVTPTNLALTPAPIVQAIPLTYLHSHTSQPNQKDSPIAAGRAVRYDLPTQQRKAEDNA